MDTFEPFKSSLLLVAAGLAIAASGCGSNATISSAPTPTPVQTGYPAASTQLWLQEFASQRAPALIANQSNPPTDALPGAAGSGSGGVVLAGYTLGTYPGFANPSGNAEAVVLRYDSLGNQQWVRQFGTGLGDFLTTAATDASENIYVAGSSNGTYPGQNTASGSKALLVKLDKSGNQLWLRELNFGPSNGRVSKVATDGAGNLLIGGTFAPLPSSGTQHAFVMRIDAATGAGLWTVQYGTDGAITSLDGLAVTSGALYVAGSNLTASGPAQQTEDIQSLDPSTGIPHWSQNIASANSTSFVSGITVDQAGSPVIAGSLSAAKQIIVGYGADPSASGFVSMLDAGTGKTTWTAKVNSGAGDEITSVTFVGGSFYAAGFSNGVLSSGYKAQVSGEFLLKVNNNGGVVWVQQFGTGRIVNIEEPYGIAETSDGVNVYLSAPTQTAFPGYTSNGLTQNVISAWSQ